MNQKQSYVVIAASVAANLHQASKIAKQLSLAAKNARAVVLRAGAEAAGFKVISNFFDEVANSTIARVELVNEIALNLSKATARSWTYENLRTQMAKAKLLGHDLQYIHTIEPMFAVVNEEVELLNQQLKRYMLNLVDEVSEIQQQMRAASVIAITSRIEAVRAGKSQDILKEMADKVEVLAEKLSERVKDSQALLA